MIKKNCRLLWDAFKVEIREITMTFSKIKAKETEELTRTLEKTLEIRVITKLPNSEQSHKGKAKTHNYTNRQNQSTTGKL
jgi:ribosome-binding protein aMBF1 (putative translation factor)